MVDVRPNDGEIIVPAGAKAVGQIQEAARSGYMRVQFDSLLLPDGVTIPIQAASQANREISQTRRRPSTIPPINLNINTSSAFQDRFQKPGLHNMPDPFVDNRPLSTGYWFQKLGRHFLQRSGGRI